MSLSINTRQAYSEIDEFLGLLSVGQRNMVPQKLREFFRREKDQEYKKGIDPTIPIKEQNLKVETLGLIALLNLKYWCQDEIERDYLKRVYANNEKEHQKMLREKFNNDNLFKKEEGISENKEETQCLQMVEHKETFFQKIINKILQFLGKK